MTPAQVKKIRKALGWTSKELAAHIGVAHNTVRCWECGRRAIKGLAAKVLSDLEKKAKKKARHLQPA